MEKNIMYVCGMSLEKEAIKQGYIKPGWCTHCLHFDFDIESGEHFCSKTKKPITELKKECDIWSVDIR